MNILDNYDLFAAHDAEQERQLQQLPVCEHCGERIQDEYAYYIEDTWICEECLKDNFRREVVPEW